jgi:5,10-methylenetetrahydrofolate reductase
MARFFNEKVPGITVPDDIIKEMDDATTPEERSAKSIEIAARTIRGLRPLCQGVHLIAAGWESRLPQVIEQSQ